MQMKMCSELEAGLPLYREKANLRRSWLMLQDTCASLYLHSSRWSHILFSCFNSRVAATTDKSEAFLPCKQDVTHCCYAQLLLCKKSHIAVLCLDIHRPFITDEAEFSGTGEQPDFFPASRVVFSIEPVLILPPAFITMFLAAVNFRACVINSINGTPSRAKSKPQPVNTCNKQV